LLYQVNCNSALLFAEERANLHIDDTQEWRMLQGHLAKSHEVLARSRAILQDLLRKIEDALAKADTESIDAPLGLKTQPGWWLLAFQISSLAPFVLVAEQLTTPLLSTLRRICN
jgi:hypothetical protein